MTNLVLYVGTVLIWGTTWFAIKQQLGVVAIEASIFYRFLLAAALLFGWCLIRKKALHFPLKTHLFLALFGVLQYSLNFLLLYHGSAYLPSGVVSVVFSTIVIWNILNGFLFFNRKVEKKILLGGLLGLVGIAISFWPDLTRFDLSSSAILGLIFALGGTMCASLGNMTSARNQKAGIPVLQANAWGTLYAACFIFLYIGIFGVPITFDFTAKYIGALAYLALFGSVLGFGFYLTLLGRIGAERAAYSSVLYPVVALGISTSLEGFVWSQPYIIGVVLILLGNFIVLFKLQTVSSTRLRQFFLRKRDYPSA